MKLKTLAWSQIVISVLLFLEAIYIITTGGETIAFELGATADIILVALFALLTGIYNLKQEK